MSTDRTALTPPVPLLAGQLLGPPAPPHQVGHTRLRVIAYDIQNPRQAARVRRLLRRWAAGDGQYSVCELKLGGADLRDLIDAVHSRLDLDTDHLAVWQPARQLAWRLSVPPSAPIRPAWPAFRHWVLAYDIRDPARLARVHRAVATRSMPLQRSVHLLHESSPLVRALAQQLLGLMAEDDRLALWPLLRAAHLWAAHAGHPACLVVGDEPARARLGRHGAITGQPGNE